MSIPRFHPLELVTPTLVVSLLLGAPFPLVGQSRADSLAVISALLDRLAGPDGTILLSHVSPDLVVAAADLLPRERVKVLEDDRPVFCGGELSGDRSGLEGTVGSRVSISLRPAPRRVQRPDSATTRATPPRDFTNVMPQFVARPFYLDDEVAYVEASSWCQRRPGAASFGMGATYELRRDASGWRVTAIMSPWIT